MVRLLTYWNSKRLSRREIYPLSHHAVDALVADVGTTRPSVRRERGPAYDRSRPNQLWHIDIKGPFFLQRAKGDLTKVWIVSLVDDHSRFLIGLRVLPRPRTAPTLDWLGDCIERCGTPIELMSDDGTPFVYWMPGVLTFIGKTLEELHVRHLRTQINSPWTNGTERALLGRPPVGGARPLRLLHARGGSRWPDSRDLLQLRPASRRARLAHASRALRRNTVHRSRPSSESRPSTTFRPGSWS